MPRKDANRTANSDNPDQIAPLFLSGSALSAQAHLSENLQLLLYSFKSEICLDDKKLQIVDDAYNNNILAIFNDTAQDTNQILPHSTPHFN